jgi:hypothetical protein
MNSLSRLVLKSVRLVVKAPQIRKRQSSSNRSAPEDVVTAPIGAKIFSWENLFLSAVIGAGVASLYVAFGLVTRDISPMEDKIQFDVTKPVQKHRLKD